MTATNNIALKQLPKTLRDTISSYLEDYEPIVVEIGDFNETTVDSLIERVEQKVDALPKKLKKRIFKITVELVQNIYRHSHIVPKELQDYTKFGFFILSKISNFAYRIVVGNFVDKTKKEYLETYLSTIKQLTINELKEYYYDILNNRSFTAKGGGGLGFLEIAKKSDSNFDFKFIKYNLDLYLFIYNVTISIENQ